MIYKTLKKVSEYCQLLDKSKYNPSKTINGVTFTNNGDGTITVNGTATKTANFQFSINIPYPKNHITLITGCPSNVTVGTYYIQSSFGNDYGKGEIKKQDRNISSGNCYITVAANATVSNLIFKPQLFDLTEMYGAGNEPTTVEEFREKFPNELYDYKPYCFVKSYKTLLKATDDKIITSYKKSLICTTKNLFDRSITTFPTDAANATLIETKENGWVLQGNLSTTPGNYSYGNGWFRPGNAKYSKSIYLKAGNVTVSAYYTVLEDNSTTVANIYLYGKSNKVLSYDRLPNVGVKTRRYKTFTIADGEEGIYYPVFTLNSSKILIEDIQVEYGTTPTEYHPYGYL